MGLAPPPQAQATSLLLPDVLAELGTDALDKLLHLLQKQEGKRARVRLACRALRDLIDCNTDHLKFRVRPEQIAAWGHGVLPSLLSRCTRCRAVTVRVEIPRLLDKELPNLGSWLLLPFTGVPLQCRARITRLTVMQLARFLPNAELHVAALVRYLPALQSVWLMHKGGLLENEYEWRAMGGYSVQPLQQQVLCDALSDCRDLTCLSLSPYRLVAHAAGCLADRLRTLHLSGGFLGRDSALDAGAAACISRLVGLRELHVRRCSYVRSLGEGGDVVLSGGPPLLLESLPASLDLLELSAPEVRGGGFPENGFSHATIRLQGGRASEVSLSCWNRYEPSSSLDRTIPELLLDSAALMPPGHVLGRLEVDVVPLCGGQGRGGSGGGPAALAAPEMEPLCALARRTAQLEVGVGIRNGAAVWETLELLLDGRRMEDVEVLDVDVRVDMSQEAELTFRVRAATTAGGSGGGGGVAAGGRLPSQGGPRQAVAQASATAPINGTASAVAAAVAAAAAGVIPAGGLATATFARLLAAAPPYQPDPAAVMTARSTAMGRCDPMALLLLRGPAVAVLAWAPDALHAWVQRLQQEVSSIAAAAAAAAGPDGGDGDRNAWGGAVARRCWLSYQAVPQRQAVLLKCSSPAVAEAVAACARSSLPGAFPAKPSASSAPASAGPGVAESTALQVEHLAVGPSVHAYIRVGAVFRKSATQIMKEEWMRLNGGGSSASSSASGGTGHGSGSAASGGSDRGGTGLGQLQRLLAQWEELTRFPEERDVPKV